MSAAPLPSDLPQELLPLSWLLGTWVGVGTGQYPGIEDFRFGQEISFATDGRPFMAYISRSWLLDEACPSPAQNNRGGVKSRIQMKRRLFLLKQSSP